MSELRPDFGDVTAEYRAARAGTGYASGVVDLVWAAGADAIEFLDGQLSQDLAAMVPGTVARALLLEPRGKLLATMWVLRGDDRIGMIVDAGVTQRTVERLEAFKFRVDVVLSIDERPAHELWGSASVATATRAALDPGAGWTDHGDHLVIGLRGGVVDRVVVLGDPAPLVAAGAVPIGSVARDTVRIEAGEPVMGVDLDTSTIPQESGLVTASVSFTKGCYVGQELVARIDSRGRVNQRLAGLVLTTNVVPPIGAGIVHDGETRGTVTSVGESLTLRAPIAMGIVRREIEDGDAVVLVWDGGQAPAVLRPLPLDDFSGPAHTPLTSSAEREDDVTGAGA